MAQTDRTREMEWVVEELGRGANRNDVIMQLCQSCGWSWQEADRFVAVTEQQKRRSIAAHQSPLLIFLGVGIVIIGVLALGYGLFEMLIVHYVSRGILAAVITGGAMVLGGSLGTWRAIVAVFRD